MSEDGEHPPDGRLIGGRYRLVERVGTGPNGTVWRARDEQDERYVAVKEPLLTGDPEDEERQRAAHRLPHEARAAAQVDHPAAVAIHDVLLDDELPWIVMELVEGESLEAALAGRGPLADADAARIGLAVLGALHAAHRVGIVHRDLKPSNVLIEARSGRVVVTDFGIGGAGHSGGRGTSTGFAAPECASGPGAGPASDLWSLGAVLRAAVAVAQAGPLGPLLQRLLVPEPEERPSAEEAARVLAEVAGTSSPQWALHADAPGAGQGSGREAVAGESGPPAADLHDPSADPSTVPEPRRLTALSALGLLLQKKPERG
ncbi:serine/threonine-protein kinase [Streptomyces canus]|uniref:serine/threonine-protein kinase n=1 Tax=Streptomyces canus TaxID=58343 RepID=UPI002E2E3255|nr:serine/threonine-protein kinase [Streptomyces canus]